MKVGTLVQREPDVLTYSSDPENWIVPNLKIGIEIELENPKRGLANFDDINQWWSRHEDGSLRDSGIELVLTTPLFGVDLTNSINAVERCLARHNFLVSNYRTGLHIHVDTRSLEVTELERLFVLYALFENSIFNFVGDDRNKNNFCAPWNRISDHLEEVFAALEGSNSAHTVEVLSNTERYSALNCNALVKFGSLEFRHMQMTKDFTKIRQWINIIMSLYKASKEGQRFGAKMPLKDFIYFVTKGGINEVAETVFPKFFMPYISNKTMWEGIMLIQDIGLDVSTPSGFKIAEVRQVCPHPGPSAGFVNFLKVNQKESA